MLKKKLLIFLILLTIFSVFGIFLKERLLLKEQPFGTREIESIRGVREVGSAEEEIKPNEEIKIRALALNPPTVETIDKARESGANYVVITQEIFVDTSGNIARYGLDSPRALDLIRKAHDKGLKVWFVIRTPLEKIYSGEREGAFLFELNPQEFQGLSKDAQENVKKNLKPIILDWAEKCEREKVEIFTPISSGQLYLVFKDVSAFDWANSLIPEVRKRYSGKLVQKIDLNPSTAQLDFLDANSAYGFGGFNFSAYDYVSTDVFTTGSPLSHEGVRTYQDFRELIRWLLNISTYFKEKYQAEGIIFGPEIMPPESSQEILEKGTEFWGHGNLSEQEMEEAKMKLYNIIFEESYGRVDGYSFWSWMPGDIITQFEVEREKDGRKYRDRIIAGRQGDGPMNVIKSYYTVTLPEIRGVVVHPHDREAVKIAKSIGANWVAIMYSIEIDWDTGEILPEEKVEGRGSKLEDVRARIREAKAAGLKVLLQIYPEYWIEGKSPEFNTHGVEGEHGPFDDQERFLEEATKFVIKTARFAEEEKVDMFSPWCEMNLFVDWNHSEKWAREILPKIREVYHGEVLHPKGEIAWIKYKIGPEGDLSFWNFSGYDYVSADIFDNPYFFDPEHAGFSKSYEDYRWFVRNFLSFLEELNQRDKTKGIILGSEVGIPEQFLAEEVKKGRAVEEVIEQAWTILFEETLGKVEGYFFYPWRGEQYLPTDPPLVFEANFSEFLKNYYKHGRFHKITCDDFNPCTEDSYNFTSRRCEYKLINGEVEGCSGRKECGFFTCVEGECKYVEEFLPGCCDDGNQETTDIWDEDLGCIHYLRTCGVLFEDNFTTFKNWRVGRGWEIRDGKAIGREHSFLELQRVFSDFSIKLKFKISEGGIHLGFRENEKGRYFVNLQKEHISLSKTIKVGSELRHPGLISKDTMIGEGWHTLQLIANRNNITLFIDGNEVIGYEDRDNPYFSGKVHIEACCEGGIQVYTDYIIIDKLCD
jgi:hypothetical protein